MTNPKINYTEEDIKQHLVNVYKEMILKRDHPEVIKQAEKYAKKFLKENQDKTS